MLFLVVKEKREREGGGEESKRERGRKKESLGCVLAKEQ